MWEVGGGPQGWPLGLGFFSSPKTSVLFSALGTDRFRPNDIAGADFRNAKSTLDERALGAGDLALLSLAGRATNS